MKNEKLEVVILQTVRRINSDFYTLEKIFTNQRLVNNINTVAPNFFKHYQILLIDKIILELSKLFDNAKQNSGKNIGFKLLIESIQDDEKRMSLNKNFDSAKISISNLLKIRHKSIAHNDYNEFFNNTTTSMNSLKSAVEEVKKLIQECYGNENFIKWQPFIHPFNEIKGLFLLLEKAQK